MIMKGREAKGAPPTDLLVCFPSRAHLALLPKPICSPARASESNKRLHLKKPVIRGGGHASPLLWTKTKSMGSEIAEPTSPKVTCAGQIKVRPKASSCRSWQSVMEEIEKIHNSRKQRKKPNWVGSLGFKKDIMQFLTCLKSLRFDLRCFGAFPETDITSEEEEEEEDEGNQVGMEGSDCETSRTVFSKWFMVLQENKNSEFCKEEEKGRDNKALDGGGLIGVGEPIAPPPNALLLMRCRSAPAKSWLEEKEKEKEQEREEHENREDTQESLKKEEMKKAKSLKSLMEAEEREGKKQSLVVAAAYNSDFYKFSSDIAKETWILGGIRDPLSRSRSWKR